MNRTLHWAEKARTVKAWRTVAAWHGIGFGRRPPSIVAVSLEVRGNARRDPANWAATVKPIVDGLVDAGCWPDDTPQWVTTIEPRLVPVTAPPPAAVATLVLLAAQSDAREGERVGGGSGPADQTVGRFLARLPFKDQLREITAEGTEAIAHLSLLGRRVGAVRLVADGPALETARKQARCTPKPEEALEAWAWDIATCQENAVKDGLCGKHYMRRWRARSSAA